MIVTVEGVMFEVTNELPREGEMYIGTYGDGEPQLCEAKTVDMEMMWVVSEKGSSPHEFDECKRVIRIIDDIS